MALLHRLPKDYDYRLQAERYWKHKSVFQKRESQETLHTRMQQLKNHVFPQTLFKRAASILSQETPVKLDQDKKDHVF